MYRSVRIPLAEVGLQGLGQKSDRQRGELAFEMCPCAGFVEIDRGAVVQRDFVVLRPSSFSRVMRTVFCVGKY